MVSFFPKLLPLCSGLLALVNYPISLLFSLQLQHLLYQCLFDVTPSNGRKPQGLLGLLAIHRSLDNGVGCCGFRDFHANQINVPAFVSHSVSLPDFRRVRLPFPQDLHAGS